MPPVFLRRNATHAFEILTLAAVRDSLKLNKQQADSDP
jgi:hypothetical protein